MPLAATRHAHIQAPRHTVELFFVAIALLCGRALQTRLAVLLAGAVYRARTYITYITYITSRLSVFNRYAILIEVNYPPHYINIC
jgi:hypothetical protein